MGAVPWWYLHIRLSQLIPAVKPWEWADAPQFWMDAATLAVNAQASAEKQLSKPK